jgi:hypothetical protein
MPVDPLSDPLVVSDTLSLVVVVEDPLSSGVCDSPLPPSVSGVVAPEVLAVPVARPPSPSHATNAAIPKPTSTLALRCMITKRIEGTNQVQPLTGR